MATSRIGSTMIVGPVRVRCSGCACWATAFGRARRSGASAQPAPLRDPRAAPLASRRVDQRAAGCGSVRRRGPAGHRSRRDLSAPQGVGRGDRSRSVPSDDQRGIGPAACPRPTRPQRRARGRRVLFGHAAARSRGARCRPRPRRARSVAAPRGHDRRSTSRPSGRGSSAPRAATIFRPGTPRQRQVPFGSHRAVSPASVQALRDTYGA